MTHDHTYRTACYRSHGLDEAVIEILAGLDELRRSGLAGVYYDIQAKPVLVDAVRRQAYAIAEKLAFEADQTACWLQAEARVHKAHSHHVWRESTFAGGDKKNAGRSLRPDEFLDRIRGGGMFECPAFWDEFDRRLEASGLGGGAACNDTDDDRFADVWHETSRHVP